MKDYTGFYKATEDIERYLRMDLIGPIKEREINHNEEPLNTYSMGILWPKKMIDHLKANIVEDEQVEIQNNLLEDEDIENEAEANGDTINASNEYRPSAMGISAMIPVNVKKIGVNFSFGKYKYEKGEEYRYTYTREPYECNLTFEIDNKVGIYTQREYNLKKLYGLQIEVYVRKIFEDGSKLITVSVVNDTTTIAKIIVQNENTIFQCNLKIKIEGNNFLPIYRNNAQSYDEDTRISDMLYSDVLNYAQGHGCSAKHIEKDSSVNEIVSDFMPSELVLQMLPNQLHNDDFLKMNYWKDIQKEVACNRLLAFVSEYTNWCEEQQVKGKELTSHTSAVQISIKNIKTCLDRLKHGVEILRRDDLAWEAFKIMNESMLLQRIKSKKMSKGSEDQVKWYPFQFAYILQILPDIVDPKSDFKETVDLLWFPTGGGKTEAYLGLCAFVIFYRRMLNNPDKDGVTIIMRYTLRLLTIQQFDRATALICACEYLRRKYNINGGEISIGLWIGSNMTPNKLTDARTKIQSLRDEPDKNIHDGNPQQIIVCPWCGSSIDIGCYSIGVNMVISCKNNATCEFHGRLPIYLIDEDIYDQCPTLILSTVDKFARIVWEEKAKALFGKDGGLPPELIIQDELHLISGPLGSIAGVYEIAVEKLCERNGLGPKIIASTATVKHAKKQIKNLYNKEMFQFPPNGISQKDSFFAVEADKVKRPARRYIGLCESGGSMASLLIRVYANLIFTKNLFVKQGIQEEVIDQYWTTVGYFNAIKDLGGSSSIINDRVTTAVKSLVNHKFKDISEEYQLEHKDIMNYEKHDELTSRKTSKEIKETLEQLSVSYTDESSYSYVLASNMLSVGIDIDRLGIMTVYNQPKSNAEYIQATSRVGRSNPGLVLTMYNTMRSRDKSHYEQFSFYHKTFYQYVEPTSVTPFSARTIEKALHCIFTGLVRHTIPGMGNNADAVKFRTNQIGVSEIITYILDRVEKISEKSTENAEKWLINFANEWERLAIENRDRFPYCDYDGNICLLNAAEKENDSGLPTTLNSLRNVDSSSNIYVLRRER